MKTTGSKSKTDFVVGQTLKVAIKRLGINGEGIGYHHRQVIFVPGALPGEEIVARVVRVEENYAIGKLLRISRPSPQRQQPFCPEYDRCGGCQLQHLAYAGQLEAKKELVVESFQRYTSLAHPPVKDTIGMDNPLAYRNKAQYQVGIEKGQVVTGLYAPNSHRLVDLSGCPIQHPKINEILQNARDLLQRLGIPIYHERKRTGIVRSLVVRYGFQTREAQLTIVTRTKELPKEKELVRELRAQVPELVSIHQNINAAKTSLIFGPETRILWGREKIVERLGPIEFELSPRAFFQLNPEQTVKLYDLVKEAAALTGKETVIDAYCGVGTIALWLAPDAREIRGIELIEEAVIDARENARKAGFSHVHFEAGKAEEWMPRWVKEGFRPDVVVVDPPRTGLNLALMDAIVHVKPKRLVYVSCNPSTLAKDADYLLKRGFRVEWIQPVDMFPHTSHVESVTLFTLGE